MDGWTDGYIDRWMARQMMDGQTDRWIAKQTDRWNDIYTYGWLDAWMATDGWMDTDV